MRITETVTVRCRPSVLWRRVGDLDGYGTLLDGATHWRRSPGKRDGLGSRWSMRLRVGSAEIGGLVEVVEYDERRDVAWTSLTGIEQRGRFRIREVEPGVCDLSLRLAYQSPGGIWGLLADRVSAPLVRSSVRRTLRRLRDEVEAESNTRAPGGAGTVDAAVQQLHALRVLAQAGLLRPSRPDRMLAAGLALHRWGATLAGGFAVNAARHPDRIAVVDDAGAVTYAELDRASSALANGLAGLGVGEGDRVGILCRNHRGFVEAAVAAGKLGADLLMLNTGFAAPQLAEVVRREDVCTIVHDAEFSTMVAKTIPPARRVVVDADDDDRADVDGRPARLRDLVESSSTRDPDPPGHPGRVTILTSGTTGTPKGASRGAPRSADPLLAILSRIPLQAGDTTLIASPLFHAWGAAHFGLASLLGSTMVLQRRFDPEGTLAAVQRHRVTALAAVPVMLQRILDLPEEVRAGYDTSSLRVVAVSGSALSGDLACRFMDAFGEVLYNLYGSTEVAWATIATPEDLRAAPGTAGRPPFGTVVRLVDDAGRDVATGQTGRIFVGNEMLFEGYTGGGGKDVLDGLMATGDVGRLDEEGRLFVEGRDDEMIVSGGENVFPGEVEDVLATHPDVAEVAVVGVPDEEWGQRLRAHVVVRRGRRLSVDDVKGHVRAHLARYKVPRDVEFVASLPRNAAGKVLKAKLAESPSSNGASHSAGGGARRTAARAPRQKGGTRASTGRPRGGDGAAPGREKTSAAARSGGRTRGGATRGGSTRGGATRAGSSTRAGARRGASTRRSTRA